MLSLLLQQHPTFNIARFETVLQVPVLLDLAAVQIWEIESSMHAGRILPSRSESLAYDYRFASTVKGGVVDVHTSRILTYRDPY